MNDNLSSEQIEILRFLRSQEGCAVSRERFFEAFPKIERKTYTALAKLGYLKVDSEADPISLTDSGKGLIDEYLSDKEEKQYQREYNADILNAAKESNIIAREANEYAKEANTIAREANKRADRANATSEESNTIARDSNKLSEKAIRCSKISNWISGFALLASIIAILVSIFVR